MVDAFSVLLERLIEPASGAALASRCQAAPCQGGSEENGAQSTAILLASFDEAWVAYLEQFVAWKFADAASLEVSSCFTRSLSMILEPFLTVLRNST